MQIMSMGGGGCKNSKFYFLIGIVFNLCLLGFFKYSDFFLENFNALSQLLKLDFNIPLPHILLPLALSFVTFQQIAFLYDCYKSGRSGEKMSLDFIDYALFISFFPQLIAGPIVHHREMIPQFKKLATNSACSDFLGSASCHIERSEISKTRKSSTFNYEFLAKGIFIFTIGLFKKLFIADSFAKWADLGFSGKSLNLIEGWVSSLSYTFQLYFDFSGYCDMAMGLGLMFGIVLPLNFNSPYKALNIADFWRRWHISLGRFLRECVYIPLGGNRGRSFKANSSSRSHSTDLANFKAVITDEVTPALKSAKNYESTSANTRIYKESMSDFTDSMESNADSSENNSLKASAVKQSPASNAKILTLRNLFIVAVLSGIWHGAGWGFVLWGLLHGGAMVIHRIYSWWLTSVNSACSEANSSSRIHSTDLANFEAVITDEVTPAPKSAKNYESTSANTRILGESQGDSMKSNAESLESSLRDSATQNLAMTAKGDSVESSEKNKMDCHALTSVKSRNDDSMLNSHASQSDSCDDKMRVDSSHSAESAKDSINSSHFVKSINENNPHNAPHLSTKHKFIKAYLNFTHTKLYLCLCFLLTFNFINIAWVFFRAENLGIALNVLKAMFGFGAALPEKWYSVSQSLSQIDGGKSSVAYIILAFVLCLVFKNSFELMQRRLNLLTISLAGILLMFLSLKMFATDSLSPFLYFNF